MARLGILGAASPTVSGVGEVYRWISYALGRGGFPPLSVIQRSAKWTQFKRAAEGLLHFIDDVFGRLDRRSKQRIILLLVQCTIDDVKASGKRPTPFNMSLALSNIREIVEKQFPGYLQCGVLAEALIDKRRSQWES